MLRMYSSSNHFIVWSILINEAYTSIKDNNALAQVSSTLRRLVEGKSRKLFHCIEKESVRGPELRRTSTSESLNPGSSLTWRLNKLILLERRRAKMDMAYCVILTKREMMREMVLSVGLEIQFILPFPYRWGVFTQWIGSVDLAPHMLRDYMFVEGNRIDQLSVIRMHALQFQPRFILPLGWTISIKEKYLSANVFMATFLRFYSRKRHYTEAKSLPAAKDSYLDSRDLLILDLERWTYKTMDLYKYLEEIIFPSVIVAISTNYNVLPTDFSEEANVRYEQLWDLPNVISFRSSVGQISSLDRLMFPFIFEGTNDYANVKICGQLKFTSPRHDEIPSINSLSTNLDTLILEKPHGHVIAIFDLK